MDKKYIDPESWEFWLMLQSFQYHLNSCDVCNKHPNPEGIEPCAEAAKLGQSLIESSLAAKRLELGLKDEDGTGWIDIVDSTSDDVINGWPED